MKVLKNERSNYLFTMNFKIFKIDNGVHICQKIGVHICQIIFYQNLAKYQLTEYLEKIGVHICQN